MGHKTLYNLIIKILLLKLTSQISGNSILLSFLFKAKLSPGIKNDFQMIIFPLLIIELFFVKQININPSFIITLIFFVMKSEHNNKLLDHYFYLIFFKTKSKQMSNRNIFSSN